MYRVVTGLLIWAAGLMVVQPPVRACTIFAFSHGSETVYGQNLDWHTPLPSLVIVNKRGVAKTVLHWKGGWPAATDDREEVSWVSRYGSVTFACYGRDFIEGGMNEAGLTVDETSLAAVYPPDDGRPGVSCTQWMQYQLDNHATVKEVIEHLDDLRPDGEGWHYLIADSTGSCAVIEYLSGDALVYMGDAVEVCALTNTTYAQALSQMSLDRAFGGRIDIAAGSDSYGRFVRIAALLMDYDPASDGGATDYAFYMLGEVSSDDTRRAVVYDAGRRRVLWKSQENPKTRWLDLDNLDLTADTPTRIVDVDSGGPGDMKNRLRDYTIEANRAIVKSILGSDKLIKGTAGELRPRGLTLEEALEIIALHPTRCDPLPPEDCR